MDGYQNYLSNFLQNEIHNGIGSIIDSVQREFSRTSNFQNGGAKDLKKYNKTRIWTTL